MSDGLLRLRNVDGTGIGCNSVIADKWGLPILDKMVYISRHALGDEQLLSA